MFGYLPKKLFMVLNSKNMNDPGFAEKEAEEKKKKLRIKM